MAGKGTRAAAAKASKGEPKAAAGNQGAAGDVEKAARQEGAVAFLRRHRQGHRRAPGARLSSCA